MPKWDARDFRDIDSKSPEHLHKRVFIGKLVRRPICAYCRVSWPCQAAQEHAALAKTFADPWWYIGRKSVS